MFVLGYKMAITHLLFIFAAGRILEGIANNLSEVNNEENHF